MRSGLVLPATCTLGSTKGGCTPPPDLPHGATLRQIVDHYIKHRRPAARDERNRFRRLESIEAAVQVATACTDQHGKRHSHQRRIPSHSLSRLQRRLGSTDLFRCSSFDELHDRIESAADDIHMIGPLTVYDVATRIGAYLRQYPKRVYLHAGTKAGARVFGLDVRRPTLEHSELPDEIQRLRPAECEDVLCIYKNHFSGALRRSRRSPAVATGSHDL